MKQCRVIEDVLARFIHGDVLLHERKEIESHIAICPSCERLYRDVTAVDRLLRNLPEKLVAPPPYLHARIMANVPESRLRVPFGAAWGRWAAVLGGAVAIALLAVAVVRTGVAPVRRTASAPAPKPAPVPSAVPGIAVTSRDPGPASQALRAPAGPAKNGPAVASASGAKIIKEVKIYFYCPPARNVAMTGDFNAWDPQGVPLRAAGKPGLWEATLRLKPGTYSYNFIVDGNLLVPDPNAANQMPDGYGGTNSVLLVKNGNSV